MYCVQEGEDGEDEEGEEDEGEDEGVSLLL